jgi:hypothetical protein
MSAPYLGDFDTGVSVHTIWSSFGADGSSITRATNGTISVYKNNGVTQSVSGITDTEDFDALTGIHALTIDLSSDGTFYSAGANFTIVLSGATIDGKSVNAVLGHFSIRNRYNVPTNLGATAAATVKTQCVDALNTDVYGEPGQEAPGVSISIQKKIAFLYKAFRNRITQDATTMKLYNDDATTVAQKATVSDNGTTFERAELVTGP